MKQQTMGLKLQDFPPFTRDGGLGSRPINFLNFFCFDNIRNGKSFSKTNKNLSMVDIIILRYMMKLFQSKL